jgi:pimeloyl-ACP methyl ester carboxylesterase
MPSQTSKFISTDHGRLAYRIDGPDGSPPILLAQRFRGTMDDWDPLFIAGLASTRRVIRFDNAGVGESDGETPDNVPGMADVAIGFLKSMGLESVDLLGWSLGGYVSQTVALNAPGRIRRLIIAGSGPGGVDAGPRPHPRVAEIAAREKPALEDLLFLFFPDTPGAAMREIVISSAFTARSGQESLRKPVSASAMRLSIGGTGGTRHGRVWAN